MAYNTNADILANKAAKALESGIGKCGGQLIANTTVTTGTFVAITIITNAVFTTLTGSIAGMDSTTFPAGVTLFGNFTTVTLASGKVIAYTAC